MSFIDYIVIFIFTLIIVFAGMAFKKRGVDMKSYFAAGGSVPWAKSGLSLFMSFFSAGTFVVWGSIAYELGLVAVVIQMTMCLSGFIVAYFIAPAWRKTNSLTAAEFIRDRLGNKVQQFLTYIVLSLSLLYAGAFLYPVAKIINVSTGFSINACIITLGILIMAYTVIGGLWAVIITDVLQFVILSVSVVLVVYLSLVEVGGMAQLIDKAPPHFFNLTSKEYSWSFIIGMGIFNAVYIGGNWAYVQRFLSVNNPQDAKKVGLTFGWLYLFSPFLWMLPPMIYRILNPSLIGLENEGAYLLICKQVLPIGFLGLMLGGMIFATASSVNTTLNLAASVITNDLFKTIQPKASINKTMWVAKLSTLLFGFGAIIVALIVPAAGGIVNVVLSVGAVTGCSLYSPVIWAIFSKRQTSQSIISITILSLSINIFLKFFSLNVFGESLSRANEMLFGSLIPLFLLGVYEIYKIRINKPSKEYIRYIKMNVTSEKENTGEEQNVFAYKVLSITLFIISILVFILAIISPSIEEIVFLMGGCILLTGLLLHPTLKNKIKLYFKPND